MAKSKRKQLPIYRRDSSETALAALAVAGGTPAAAPVLGYDSLTVWARSPVGAFTIDVQQFLKGSSTAITTTSMTCAAGSYLSQAVTLTGELVKIVLTNGASEQAPEVLIKLV